MQKYPSAPRKITSNWFMLNSQPVNTGSESGDSTILICLHTNWPKAFILHGKDVCVHRHTWWRHQMEIFSALLAICARNSPVPVNSPHKGQWHGALMFSLICVWVNGWVTNGEAGDVRRYRAHYDVIVMYRTILIQTSIIQIIPIYPSDAHWIPVFTEPNTVSSRYIAVIFSSYNSRKTPHKWPVRTMCGVSFVNANLT